MSVIERTGTTGRGAGSEAARGAKSKAGYEVIPLSPARKMSIDMLRVSHDKHVVHGLVEADVTEPRRRIRDHAARTGEKLSFTGFVIACVARAVAENRTLNAIRSGRRLVVYDEVDVNTMVERRVRGELVVAPYIVRSAQQKSVDEIHREIRDAQMQSLEHAGGLVKVARAGTGWIYRIPSPVRRALIRRVGRSPRMASRFGGVVGVTAVGMFGDGPGWGIPLVPATLSVTVGGIGRRPRLDAGALVEQEYVCLTLTFDHEIVDGAPAARFSARLKELIESGAGLPEA